MLFLQHNLNEFNRTLSEYVRLAKRDVSTLVAKKGRDVSLRLAGFSGPGPRHGGFGPPIQADPDKIEREAEARGWRVKRRPDQFTPVGPSGVSRAAEMAVARRFANPSKYSRRQRGLLRLNRRAALVQTELAFRRRAAAGGTLAASFVTRRFPRRPGQVTVKRNRQGRRLAAAKLTENHVNLQAWHPALRKFPHVFARVLRDAEQDMRRYIVRKARQRWARKLGVRR